MSDKKYCIGTYKVSGYTKSDGTKVSSYMRTCGAKHEGDNNSSEKHSRLESAGMNSGAANLWNAPSEDVLIHSDKYIEDKINQGALYKQQMIAKYITNEKSSIHMKYYKISLDLDNQKQYNKENAYIKFKDIDDSILKNIIKEQCDITNLNNNTDVVIPQYGSPFMNKFINSLEFVNFVKEHEANIKAGKYKNKCLPITFSSSRDLRLTVGHGAIYNPRYVDGVLYGTFWDGYNFEHKHVQLMKELESISNLQDIYNVGKDIFNVSINNNAYEQQKHGLLKNYLIIMPIILFENKKDDII